MVKKLIIFIPAYNAEKTICSVIKRIPNELMNRTDKIVVSDNNSSDQTIKIITEFKEKNNISKITITKNEKNLFFGGNIKSGCNIAVKENADIIAILHADGQYPPEKILDLIKPIEDEFADAVSGSRFLEDPLKGGMPYWRYLGNIFLTKVENILVGKKLSEWHSGFRAYNVNALKKIPFNLCVNGYEWTTDILLMLLTSKYKIAEIAIPTHYGEESTSPSIKRTFEYFINSFKIAFIFFLNRIGIIKIKKYSKIIKDFEKN